ncbi:CoA ester lyase [Pseudomonas syringae pv. dysoxyli]|uniref:HpcH/HpaI aldolase/citrate lyase family protein n=1 Tax=Pseudomonas syringae TaxID=317 RepID=UPI001372EF90|nr:CoA ester lyase [Pseudomonas syringae]NAO28813.1 CoA ester lyase [Pseudomonas syringae pv. dysoxyli]
MRSKLFVPGSRPELFEKAMASLADGISFDLEDAVAFSAKDEARNHLVTFLGGLTDVSKTIVVRVNDMASAYYRADLEALVGTTVHIINLPKVEDPAQILQFVADLEALEQQRSLPADIRILANIESPRGLRCAAEIACAHPRVMGLQIGYADLLEPLGVSRNEPSVIRHIQLTVRLAAGEAGIAAYDGAFASVKDSDGYLAESNYARSVGFAGKSCIHPTQIALANQAFLPSDSEVAEAQRVLAAAAQAERDGMGAYLVDGKMIDKPFVERAEAILIQARTAGMLTH